MALKAGIFAQSGILGKMDGGLIGRFLTVLFALDRRAQIDHFTRLLMHEHEVLVRMGPLLTAVMGFLPVIAVRALAPALGAV